MTLTATQLDPVTSPLLGGVKHGFFTRIGGASTGIFAGLNCGGKVLQAHVSLMGMPAAAMWALASPIV